MYSSYLGVPRSIAIYGMAMNAAGQIYVTGITNALDYPTTSGVIQPTCPAGNPSYGGKKCGVSSASSAFVSKISADGQSLIYSTYLVEVAAGTEWADRPWVREATAAIGHWHRGGCIGQCMGRRNDQFEQLPHYGGCIQPLLRAGGNSLRRIHHLSEGQQLRRTERLRILLQRLLSVFLVKLNPIGTSMLYGTFLGGTNGEVNAQIASMGRATFMSRDRPTQRPRTFAQTSYYNYPTTASAYQTQALAGGEYSAFVTKFAPDGKSLLYSTMFGGPLPSTVSNALAVGAGKIFIGGYTRDPHLPTTPGALSSTCPGGPTAAGPTRFV